MNNGQKANISASVSLPDGATRTIGPKEFRIKSIPDPVAKFAGKYPEDSQVRKAELTAASGCIAEIRGFLFPVQFRVTSFDIGMVVSGNYATAGSDGNRVSSDQKAILERARNGQKVDIYNIRAIGPEGRTRKLGALTLRVRG